MHEQGYVGEDQLGEALKGADIIIIPAGVPRKPGMTRDDLFKVKRCFFTILIEHDFSRCHMMYVNAG